MRGLAGQTGVETIPYKRGHTRNAKNVAAYDDVLPGRNE